MARRTHDVVIKHVVYTEGEHFLPYCKTCDKSLAPAPMDNRDHAAMRAGNHLIDTIGEIYTSTISLGVTMGLGPEDICWAVEVYEDLLPCVEADIARLIRLVISVTESRDIEYIQSIFKNMLLNPINCWPHETLRIVAECTSLSVQTGKYTLARVLSTVPKVIG